MGLPNICLEGLEVQRKAGIEGAAEGHRRYSRLNRVLRVVTPVCAMIVACLTVWAVAQALPAGGATEGAEYVTVVVKPGDTLWSIAKRIGGNRVDPRVVCEQIRSANGIANAMIWPGQVLRVPPWI
jgi:nucleoid-associated protein YgaU